jgi:RHS repeat-associated protein
MAERYDPYGVPIVTAGENSMVDDQNPYTFAGAGVYMRLTQWIHYGNPYYSVITGTFTQQDTLDAPLNPQNANRYAFAGGDPVNNVDPRGADIGDAVNKIGRASAFIQGVDAALNGDPEGFARVAGGVVVGEDAVAVCEVATEGLGGPVCAGAGIAGAEAGARAVGGFQSLAP